MIERTTLTESRIRKMLITCTTYLAHAPESPLKISPLQEIPANGIAFFQLNKALTFIASRTKIVNFAKGPPPPGVSGVEGLEQKNQFPFFKNATPIFPLQKFNFELRTQKDKIVHICAESLSPPILRMR